MHTPGGCYIDFNYDSDESVCACVLKPEYDVNKFPLEPMPLHTFLKFLENQKVLNPQLVNHSEIKRSSAAESAKGRVTYNMTRVKGTKWKPATDTTKDDYTYWALKLDLAKVLASQHLRILLKLECRIRHMCIITFAPEEYQTVVQKRCHSATPDAQVLRADQPACAGVPPLVPGEADSAPEGPGCADPLKGQNQLMQLRG